MGGFIVFIEWLNRLKVEFIGLRLSVGMGGDHLTTDLLVGFERVG